MGIDSCCLKSMWMSHVMIEFLWYFCFPLTLEYFFSDSGLICFGVSWGRGFTLNPHLSFLSLSNLWLCACAQSISTWGLTLCDFVDCSLPGSLVDGNFPGKNTGVELPFPPPGDLSDRDQTCVFCLGQWVLYHRAAWVALSMSNRTQIAFMWSHW